MALSHEIRKVLLLVLVISFANHAQAMISSGMEEPQVSVIQHSPEHRHFDGDHSHRGADPYETHSAGLDHPDDTGECHHGCCKSAACCHLLLLAQTARDLWSHPQRFIVAAMTRSLRPLPKPEGRPPKSL
jgi:hypothetical protein